MMQEQQSITLSAGYLAALNGDNTETAGALQNELELNLNKIAAMLSSYHWHEKGMVENVQVDAASICINEQGEGNFTVKYGINIHYGCSDVSIDLDKRMVISIKTDKESGTALLTGEYIPEREPDSY